jgi:hypothetical protein
MTVEAFGIEKEFLQSLLNEVRDGKAQLPEFQRDWVWPDQNMISLLASISLGYPVGTLMLLRAGGDGVRFKQRPIQGATLPLAAKAERLILDGQQRLTSLFQSLVLQSPVKTHDVRRKPIEGWLYIDMRGALDPNVDREEAIRFVPADRMVRNFRGEVVEDYSTPEKEYAALLFPLNKVFDQDDWHMGYQEYWDYEKEKSQFWNAFRKEVLDPFKQYLIPVIELGKDTQRQAVCQVFEKVNTGGVTLTVFELLTATFAADEFDLRADWEQRQHEFKRPEFKVLRDFANTDFLQAVTLLATRERRDEALTKGVDAERAPRIGCRRSDMLALTLDQYKRWTPVVVDGLKRAAKFLHGQYFYDTRFLPYGSQLVPLAAIFGVLDQEAEPAGAQQKIARWFWCGVMGELYGGTTETRFSRDLPDVVEWVRGGAEPRTVTEAVFSPARLLTLRTRNSAAYKGIYALLLGAGAADWRTGEKATILAYFDNAIDIHHIFPKAWSQGKGIPAQRYDSIVNKTPLAARTNRVIGGRAPSDYLERIANGAGISAATLDQNVATHIVDPTCLRADDFDGFFEARSRAILRRIEQVMGKPVVLGVSEPESDEESDDDDDE